MYLLGREQWALRANGAHLAKQFLAPNLELPLPDRPSHQFRDNRTLILIPEGLIKGLLNLVGDTEIDSRHDLPPLLNTSTMVNISLRQPRSRLISMEFRMEVAVPVFVRRQGPPVVATGHHSPSTSVT
jgi:hypothetical protein